jgi:hypothetical protein
MHEILVFFSIMQNTKLVRPFGCACATSQDRVVLPNTISVRLVKMTIECLKVDVLFLFASNLRVDIKAFRPLHPYILRVLLGVTWLIESASVLQAILKCDIIDSFSNFEHVFLVLSRCEHFFVTAQGPLLNSLFNLLDLISDLGFIC